MPPMFVIFVICRLSREPQRKVMSRLALDTWTIESQRQDAVLTVIADGDRRAGNSGWLKGLYWGTCPEGSNPASDCVMR